MEFFSVILFAIVSTLTPGPNNALIMGSAVNFGVKRSVPLLLGMCLGFPALILVSGFGVGVILRYVPEFYIYMKIIGSVYLLYLAYKIFKVREVASSSTLQQPLGFLHGAAFQWINPKSWIVAASAMSSFAIFSERTEVNAVILSAIFIVVSIVCVGSWMVAGHLISGFLDTENKVVWFNRIMGILLAVSVLQAFLIHEGRG
ncbi:LysE family translocator [Methylobacterium sp. SyP6R]|uniref:LysE family translocator n=1 Tax=Methylobacterium sp. SyP6R TaxID=2718876 RepID=UPI001F2DC2DB|nr:LysE family translocator [Methylobacterium sp. SyP6R]MCF4130023.1 LysE family translocator [Methylobacterium sp. SyP6R]